MVGPRDAARFIVAYYDWVRAGRPRRTPEQVKELYAICQSCPRFNPKGWTTFGRGRCDLCLCHISPDATRDMNKLIWPTEGCPDVPPKWTATVAPNPEE